LRNHLNRSTLLRASLPCALLAAAAPACRQPAPTPPANARLVVTVAIQPQAYFVEQIAGDHADVQVLVGPGQSPHSYEPTPKQMSHLAESRLYFKLGLPFEEKLLAKVEQTSKHLRIVDTREGIQLRKMEEWEAEGEEARADEHGRDERTHDEHSHGEHHEGEHASALDPHSWLAPRLAKVQAQTMSREFCRLDPPHAADYERNLKALEAALDAADKRIAELLAPMRGQEFFVFHPAFGYFADAYGLKQVAVETGGKQPGAKQLSQLIERARASNVKLIFVQRQFPTASADAIAEAIGGAVVPIDDLAKDYVANLEDIAKKIAAIGGAPPSPGPSSGQNDQ
jgi:zinc transport system substrate-binding protein